MNIFFISRKKADHPTLAFFQRMLNKEIIDGLIQRFPQSYIYAPKESSTPETLEKYLKDYQPQIVLLEKDVLLCHHYLEVPCLEKIRDWLTLLRGVPLNVSSPDLLELASFKSYYREQQFSPYIIEGTRVITDLSLTDEYFHFDSIPKYITKIPHSSSDRGVVKNITRDNVHSKVNRINELLYQWHVADVILQPQLEEFLEYKAIFVGDVLFDLMASESFSEKAQGQVIMSMNQLGSCTEEIWRYYLPHLSKEEMSSEYCKGEKSDTLSYIICYFNYFYREYADGAVNFCYRVYNTLREYLGYSPIYCRIDIFYDLHSGNFYLNEIEPYSSAKFAYEMVLCSAIKRDRETAKRYFQRLAQILCTEIENRYSKEKE